MKIGTRTLSVISAVALCLIWLVVADAQTILGSIVGAVTDSTGAVLPQAEVTLTEIQTGVQRKGATNAEGIYVFANIKGGVYRVEVANGGFRTLVSGPITLTTQQTARFDAVLQVGEVTQRMEVAATAATINTENAQLGDVLARQDILNLPANTRSTMAFRYVTSSNYDGGHIGGQRSEFGHYTIDGVSGMATAWSAWVGPVMEMSLEGVQEIKFVTGNPSAEYGDVATVYIASRSGTNDLHGSAFYDHSNNAFNARNFFAAAKPKGPILHEFGGSIGGPVYLPKLYNGKNRSFFFFAYERQKRPGQFSATATVPTALMRTGNFSQVLATRVVRDPTNGQPFSGNILPLNRISAVSQKIQAPDLLPMPNFGAAESITNNFTALYPQNRMGEKYTFRGDHTLRQSDTISARVNLSHADESGWDGPLGVFYHDQFRNTRNALISETHLFSPTLVNEIRLGYTRDFSDLKGRHEGSDLINNWGIQGVNLATKGGLTGVPRINFVNFQGYSEFGTYFWAQETIDLMNNVTWIKGKHTLKTGVNIRRARVNISENAADFGSYSFDGFASGFDYSDFLLGLPRSTSRYERAQPRANRFTTLIGYVQDDWRVNGKLTLNFGLRYEFVTAPIDKHDMRFTFDTRNGNLVVPNETVLRTLVSPLFPKTIPIVTAAAAGFPERSLIESDGNNWGPRAGFAYRPLAANRLVIRGGFGSYYTPLTGPLMDRFAGGPFVSSESFLNSITNGVALLSFPRPFTNVGTVPTQSVGAIGRKPLVPYTHQWNLTLEREFRGNLVGRVIYRGHRTLQILNAGDLNKPFPSADAAQRNYFTYPNFFSVDYATNGGIQKGHLLETAVERKFARDLTFQAGWTWAKVLTDVHGGDVMGRSESPNDRRREMGDVGGVVRHRFSAAGQYEIPFGTGKRYGGSLPRFVRQSLGNWQLSSIFVKQTGTFGSVTFTGQDPSNTRTVGGRADWLSDWQVEDPTILRWFNPSAFAIPANGRYGNGAPNLVTGPGLTNFDFGLFKFFQVAEKARLQLRMTATNFFNHTNFGAPNRNISAINVGRITGTNSAGFGGGARTIRLAARFDF
ncbi:MAG: TonB-dependent receptor [Acidobacteria bacterium]|nr:TonB-dependent receptor [Acidobacteriota bacterium]